MNDRQRFWMELLAIGACGTALGLPFFDISHWWWIGTAFVYPLGFAAVLGRTAWFDSLWNIALILMLIGAFVSGLLAAMLDTTSESVPIGYFCLACTGTALVSFIICVQTHSVTRQLEVQAAQETLRLQNAQYQLLREGPEADLPSLRPDLYGCNVSFDARLIYAVCGVTLGAFEQWDSELSEEIGAEAKVAGLGGTFKRGEKTKRAIATFVEQSVQGNLLIFLDRILFIAPESPLDLASKNLKLVLWIQRFLIMDIEGRDKPYIFRIPAPDPPWLAAAAADRAFRASRAPTFLALQSDQLPARPA